MAQNRFELYAPGTKPIPFTQKEKEAIESVFPAVEVPIHFTFRTDIRVEKQTHRNDICALSPHFIACFTQKNYGEKPVLYYMFHIQNIELMCYSADPFVFIKTNKTKFTVTGNQCLKFAQLVYRNFIICYPTLLVNDVFEVRAPDRSLFPFIQLPVSLSQVFQFAYAAFATAKDMEYHHEVVRYVHNMIVSANPILDLSQLPASIFKDTAKASAFDPIFQALFLSKAAPGICCVNQARPRILYSISDPVERGIPFKLIHFENCGITEGMDHLRDKIFKREDFPVYYWSLSKNHIKNWAPFWEILGRQRSALKHLALNYCGMQPKDYASLFKILNDNQNLWSIKNLHLAESDIDKKAYAEMERFFQTIAENNSAQIVSLDLSRMKQNTTNILKLIAQQQTLPLRDLNLSGSDLGKLGGDQLILFIAGSKTLRKIDISFTKLSPDLVEKVIGEISKNEDLTDIDLRLNGLNLHGKNLTEIYRGFLNGSDDDKWRKLHMDDNGIDEKDLLILIPLLKELTSLEEVTFNRNFNSTMPGIGNGLCELLKIKSLTKIGLAGDSNHQLRGQLVPFLQRASAPKLVSLDISGNAIGDSNYRSITNMIQGCTTLQTMQLDNNGVQSSEAIFDMVKAVQSNPSMISLLFPNADATRIIAGLKKEAQAQTMQRLSDAQITLMQAINEHRASRGMKNDLPFDVTPEVQEIIDELIYDYRGWLKRFKKLKTHSCVCEELNLPLPFQRMGDVVENGGNRKAIRIDEMEIYETESMKWVIKEENINYADFNFETTVNPDFTTYATGMLPGLGAPPGSPAPAKPTPAPQPEPEPVPDPDPDQKTATSESIKTDDFTIKTRSRNPDDFDGIGKRKKKGRNFNDSESDSDSDSYNPPPKGASKRKPPKKTSKRFNDSDSDTEEPKRPSKRNRFSDSDSNSDEPKRPAKKAKGVFDDSYSDDTPPRKPKRPSKRRIPDSDSDDDVPSKSTKRRPKRKIPESDSDEAPARPKSHVKRRIPDSDSDETPVKRSPKRRIPDSDSDETPIRKPAKRPTKRRIPDSDSDSDEPSPPKRGKNTPPSKGRRFDDSDSDEPIPKKRSQRRFNDSDSDEIPPKRGRKTPPAKGRRFDSDSDSDEIPPKRGKKTPPAKGRRFSDSDSDEPSPKKRSQRRFDDSDSDEMPPARKNPTKRRIPSSDDSDEASPKRQPKRHPKKIPDSDSDPGTKGRRPQIKDLDDDDFNSVLGGKPKRKPPPKMNQNRRYDNYSDSDTEEKPKPKRSRPHASFPKDFDEMDGTPPPTNFMRHNRF